VLSNSQFKVYDFNAAKMVKNRTGRAAAIPMSRTPDSPAMIKHENEAMAMGNPAPAKKPSMYSKVVNYLGLE
jgi:hypothetical protein